MKNIFKAVPLPDQVKRLLVIIVLIVVGFLVVKKLLVPESYGRYGNYRGAAIDSIGGLKVKYAGHAVCFDCHDDIAAEKKDSHHRTVNCEACHGPSAEHVASFDTDEVVLPFASRDRGYCPLCHVYDPAKPTGFPQIDPVSHNPVKPCISCHNPHAPEPPTVPGECSACHEGITRTKALSPHGLLECTECHVTSEEHMNNPRSSRPTKPGSRNDCGKCHAQDSESEKHVPKISMAAHGEGYLCWQCHYPHYPEGKL